jgi:hypothetical protein
MKTKHILNMNTDRKSIQEASAGLLPIDPTQVIRLGEMVYGKKVIPWKTNTSDLTSGIGSVQALPQFPASHQAIDMGLITGVFRVPQPGARDGIGILVTHQQDPDENWLLGNHALTMAKELSDWFGTKNIFGLMHTTDEPKGMGIKIRYNFADVLPEPDTTTNPQSRVAKGGVIGASG